MPFTLHVKLPFLPCTWLSFFCLHTLLLMLFPVSGMLFPLYLHVQIIYICFKLISDTTFSKKPAPVSPGKEPLFPIQSSQYMDHVALLVPFTLGSQRSGWTLVCSLMYNRHQYLFTTWAVRLRKMWTGRFSDLTTVNKVNGLRGGSRKSKITNVKGWRLGTGVALTTSKHNSASLAPETKHPRGQGKKLPFTCLQNGRLCSHALLIVFYFSKQC